MNTAEGLSALGELGGIGRGHVAIEFWEVSAGTLDVLKPEKLCVQRVVRVRGDFDPPSKNLEPLNSDSGTCHANLLSLL